MAPSLSPTPAVFGLGARGPGVSVVDVAAERIGQRGWFLTSGPDALYVTDDGWSHHEVLDVPCPAVTRPAGLSASEDATWLACGGEPGTIMQEKHVYRSSDDGRTWTPIASTGSYGGDRQIEATGLMPSSGHLAGIVVHRTSDAGETWANYPFVLED